MVQKWRRYFKNKVIVAIVAFIFAVALSAIISLLKSVETQSLLEQESLTPAFNLVSEEIVKPLFIAETIARASSLKTLMNDTVIDQIAIEQKLKDLSEEFKMEFFVANESNRTQYNSDGPSLALDENKVEWYFRAKKTKHKIVGILGNRQDIRIYYDVKVHNDEGEFLGFIGLNKKLTTFINAFDDFKRQYGYDFVFVDHNDNIVLSSDTNLVADGKRILQLNQLPWYAPFISKRNNINHYNNYLVEVAGDDLLIAEADFESLNWKMFLINPLKVRQIAATEDFIIQTVYIIIAIFTAILIIWLIGKSLQGEFAKRHQRDPLTQLPNRAHLAWHYEKVARMNKSIAVIMVDLDHFKDINDTYGHSVGDKALCEVATLLQSFLRDIDIVARWGGEEFVILLPAADITIANHIADRARTVIAKHIFVADKKVIQITASFGISADTGKSNLTQLIDSADAALYEAKNSGRNKVCSVKQPVRSNPQKTYAHG
ncbi:MULTISPECIES: sensor domain-containing diguanylate cyclase [Aliiglaciecola]|uniref:sensor domain-containing diguanylate cyclase n=1 Tax=Aliiglaciecola TaxID=1406885 RepID=UPI001C085989|nr:MULTISPECIES: sensor domain-containing diguanylate cyclase [Aliiglaciecola]MBU2876638.1 sensor domain-containing diguanylate cyclase [Aliiglaciecola lipolytica]MDO6711427.1 sensor domain-containing diguanylate cyclase [Aliiglaciecola sp. 2_MG-2023]MDO6752596.1 sensor domain-containing diguanylate cyclase [Aliiglaciecola sp. 1_MG-2023]